MRQAKRQRSGALRAWRHKHHKAWKFS